MKTNFSRKALLMVAVALGLGAVVPAQAMDATDANVNQEVAAKTGLFSSLSKESLQKRLNETMRTLNKQWASFMKCAKGKGCTFSQKAAIVATLTTVLAIVAVLGGHRLDAYTGGYAGAPKRALEAGYATAREKAAQLRAHASKQMGELKKAVGDVKESWRTGLAETGSGFGTGI
jgi:hypothetical protein